MNYSPGNIDFKQGVVEMAHGGGGKAMAHFIETLFVQTFNNPQLNAMNDQAIINLPSVNGGSQAALSYVMATDSHVISPLFFPGGNIGCLSVHGTVNDVVMSGARPLYLSASFILEEGYPLADLKRIVTSMSEAAKQANIQIITGDTKVVERGKGDGVFINTTGVGVIEDGHHRTPLNIRAGDKIILSGTLGDHGIAVMSQRENLKFETEILSDTQSLQDLVATMIKHTPAIRCMRDPTRGGLSAVLNEIAHQAKVGMTLHEKQIPILPQVNAACEFLGLDPLNVANEGKLVAFCPPGEADTLLACMRAHPQGLDASIIGEVTEDKNYLVHMQTTFGGGRLVNWLSGEQLPRIC